jgi:hypothetical protein
MATTTTSSYSVGVASIRDTDTLITIRNELTEPATIYFVGVGADELLGAGRKRIRDIDGLFVKTLGTDPTKGIKSLYRFQSVPENSQVNLISSRWETALVWVCVVCSIFIETIGK